MPTGTHPGSLASNGRDLSHEDRQELTQRLLLEARDQSDATARQELLATVIELNHRVAVAIARRYAGRGVPAEDLEQAASEGLVKAVQRFDTARDRDLLSYAVPTIRGEVLRHFRDHSWTVRPPRRIQELQQQLRRAKDELSAAQGRDPTTLEVRDSLGVSAADHREADAAQGCFQPTSLDVPMAPGSSICLGDLLTSGSGDLEAAEARAVLAGIVRRLGHRQQRVIYLRFVEERTQCEIGQEFGVTQATVSRWLAETLDALRGLIGPAAA